MKLSRSSAALFLLFVIPCTYAQKSKPIEKNEIAKWTNRMEECPADQPPYFYKVDYYDFKGDGTRQAIVIASTCMTGTAGPDVHSVIGRNSNGELEEMKIAEVDPATYDNMFGNRNYRFSVENGLLVATFSDDPDRDTPLIIKYKWNGREFSVVSIQKTGIFPTSYNCNSKSLSEVENAICHVDALAGLDVQMAKLYRSLLTRLTGQDRETLREEQRVWLIVRDKQCAPFKGWVSCISGFYEKRIDELKKRAPAPSPNTETNSHDAKTTKPIR